MKYRQGGGYYLPISRKLFNDEKFKKLSKNARWLYVVLCEDEHRFSKREESLFFRTDEDLADDASMTLATLKRAKSELRGKKQEDETYNGVVTMGKAHFVDQKTGKRSRRHITTYSLQE